MYREWRDGGWGMGDGELSEWSSLILSEESTLIDRTQTTPSLLFVLHSSHDLRLFLPPPPTLHIRPLRTNQHHTNESPIQQSTIMRRLMIIIPKHLYSELLALQQIMPAEQVHSLRIRKSGVKGCESAFADYEAGLRRADLEFVGRECAGHSSFFFFFFDWRGRGGNENGD